MKTCIRCGETKQLTEFYKHPQMADGHLNVCILCKKAYARKYGKTSKGREGNRQRYHRNPARRAAISETTKRWRQEFPERYKAHSVLNNAVRNGRLFRPQACQECGATGVKIHGHHEDYSKPLEVIWLCNPCHGRRYPSYIGD